MIEVEKRYKVYDIDTMVQTLSAHKVTIEAEQHVIDKWFVPKDVNTRDKHDKWFDVDHGMAYRIRKVTKPDGSTHIVLDSKQHTAANDHNTFAEEIIMHDKESAMRAFLDKKGYYNWLTIDKVRRSFVGGRPELQITMDTVEGVRDQLGLDTVLEIEYAGEGTRDAALAAIDDFSAQVGLGQDMLFEKSLTVESMAILARFQ